MFVHVAVLQCFYMWKSCADFSGILADNYALQCSLSLQIKSDSCAFDQPLKYTQEGPLTMRNYSDMLALRYWDLHVMDIMETYLS